MSTIAEQYLQVGYAHYKREKFLEAINNYDAALAIDPDFFFAFYQRATAKTELGDFLGAIADYTEAIRLLPQLEDSFVERGNVRLRMRDKAGAEADFQLADAFDPRLYDERGQQFVASGDHDNAFEAFDTGVTLLEAKIQLDAEWTQLISGRNRPHAPHYGCYWIYLHRARLREATRRFEEALEDFQLFLDAGITWDRNLLDVVGPELRKILQDKKKSE